MGDSAKKKKKTPLGMFKNNTPPQGSGVYPATALPIPRKDGPPSRKTSAPIPLVKRASQPRQEAAAPAADSCPTPVFELGWRQLSARLQMLGSRLSSQALVYRKHPIKMDLSKAKKCENLAEECQLCAERVANWPNLSGSGLAGEKNYVAQRYLDIMTEATDMFGEKVL